MVIPLICLWVVEIFPFPNLTKEPLKLAVIGACLESRLGGRTLKFIIFFIRGLIKTRQSTTLASILLKLVKFPSLSPGVWQFVSSRLWLLQIINNFLPEVFALTSQEHLLPVSKVVPSMPGSRWFSCLPSFSCRPSSFPVLAFRSSMIKMSPLSLYFISISFSFQK